MESNTPVALFTYNRPSHTRRALDALKRCLRKEECDFYFFSDGPKTEEARASVEKTRAILHDESLHFNAEIIEQNQNLGLAKSIVSGVSQLCQQYGRVIVIEDDLVVEKGFLHFMLESLDRYENEKNVMQVGGFTIKSPKNLTADAFLLPLTTTWGWATWQRAWSHFSWEAEDLEDAKSDPEWCRLFDLNGTCSFSDMLANRLAGKNDSWGILWWYTVSKRRGLVVYPHDSLVWNGGFDGSGVHCSAGDPLGQNGSFDESIVGLSGQSSKIDKLRKTLFPAKLSYDPSHLETLEDYFRTQATAQQRKNDRGIGRTPSILQKLKLFAKKIIH